MSLVGTYDSWKATDIVAECSTPDRRERVACAVCGDLTRDTFAGDPCCGEECSRVLEQARDRRIYRGHRDAIRRAVKLVRVYRAEEGGVGVRELETWLQVQEWRAEMHRLVAKWN